jgi:hypothetical protein
LILPGAWAAFLLLASPDIGARITASAVGAEAFQGPLDGAWVIRDAAGRPLYFIQFADPVPGHGDLQAAWRDPAQSSPGGVGPVTAISLKGHSLTLVFTPRGGSVSVTLTQAGKDHWTGLIERRGRQITASLSRP